MATLLIASMVSKGFILRYLWEVMIFVIQMEQVQKNNLPKATQ